MGPAHSVLPRGSMIGVLSSVSHGLGAYIVPCGDGCFCFPGLNPLNIGIQWLSPLVLIPSLLSNLVYDLVSLRAREILLSKCQHMHLSPGGIYFTTVN